MTCVDCTNGSHDVCQVIGDADCGCPCCSGLVPLTGFHFEEVSHTYWLDGVRLLSVTQIMDAGGLTSGFDGIPPAVLERKRNIGIAVHAAAHYIDEGDLDESSVDPAAAPYVDAYRKFKVESGFIVQGAEETLHDPSLGFAGTLDRRGLLLRVPTIIDLKCVYTLTPRTVAVQLSAYNRLVVVNGHPAPQKRYALHLKPNGTYKLVPCEDPHAWTAFHAALLECQGRSTEATRATIARWKEAA